MANIGRSPCDAGAVIAATEAPPVEAATKRWVLAASILGSSMAFIDGTVVNVALPALQNAFHANVAQVQWVVEAYALFLASLLLAAGAAGDRYGRRRIFVAGIIVFALASAGCGLARTINELIAMRSLQGVGAALLVPESLALISSVFPSDERGRAIGTWSGFTAITAAIGPVLGGWLVQNASWRWIFFLNVPIAAVVAVICWWRVPESRDAGAKGSLDWRGALLATAGLSGVVFALVEAKGAGRWTSAIGITGALLLGFFLYTETKSPSPMLPLDLFRSRDFTGANLLTLFLYTGLSGALFFLPLNLIQVEGYSATAAGAALLPFILLMFLLSRWSGGLIEHYGSRLPLTVGPLIAAVGFVLFAISGMGSRYWTSIFPAVLVLGFGMTISVAPLTATVMTSIDQNRAGIASGVNNAVSRLAGLLGIAVLGLLLVQIFDRQLDRLLDTPSISGVVRTKIQSQRTKLAAAQVDDKAGKQAIFDAFLSGYRAVFWTAAGLAVASSITAALVISPTKPGATSDRK